MLQFLRFLYLRYVLHLGLVELARGSFYTGSLTISALVMQFFRGLPRATTVLLILRADNSLQLNLIGGHLDGER